MDLTEIASTLTLFLSFLQAVRFSMDCAGSNGGRGAGGFLATDALDPGTLKIKSF